MDKDDELWFNHKWNVPWYAVQSCFARLSEQVVSLIEVESVSGISLLDTRTLSHRRNNFNFSRKTGEPAFVVPCPSECKEFSHNGSKEHFVRSTCKIRGTFRKERSHTTTGFNFKFSTTHGPQGEQSTMPPETYSNDFGFFWN